MKVILIFISIALVLVQAQDKCSRQDFDSFEQCVKGTEQERSSQRQQKMEQLQELADTAALCIESCTGGGVGRKDRSESKKETWNCVKQKMLVANLEQCDLKPLSFMSEVLKERSDKRGEKDDVVDDTDDDNDVEEEDTTAAPRPRQKMREIRKLIKKSCKGAEKRKAKKCFREAKQRIMGDPTVKREERCTRIENCKTSLKSDNPGCAEYMESSCECMDDSSGRPDRTVIEDLMKQCNSSESIGRPKRGGWNKVGRGGRNGFGSYCKCRGNQNDTRGNKGKGNGKGKGKGKGKDKKNKN